MIKVIRPGTKKQIECNNCGALLSYDEKEDIKFDSIKKVSETDGLAYHTSESYIICPQCNKKIIFKSCR